MTATPDFEAKAREIAFDIMSVGWREEGKPEEIIFFGEEVEPKLFSAISSAISSAVQAERERIEAIVTDVMDECSAKMHKHFAREQDISAEVFRLRMEGAARVAQKLGMLVPADEDASAIRKENDNG